MTGKILTSKSPALLTARLTNGVATDNDNVSIAPASSTVGAVVGFRSTEHLATVAPSGVSVEPTGVCGYTLAVVLDGADTPSLLAATQDPGTTGVFDRFYALWTRGSSAWSADFVYKDGIRLGPYGTVEDGIGVGAVIPGSGAAGQPRAVLSNTHSNGFSVYERAAPGIWNRTASPSDRGYDVVAVVDSLGRLRIIDSTLDSNVRYHYTEWIDGQTLTDFRTDGRFEGHPAAAGLSGLLGVARTTADGIVVTYSDGATVGQDHPVSGTTPYPRSAEPCYRSSYTCTPVVCQTEGVVPETVALASTSDGTLWMVYRYVHYTDHYTVVGTNTSYCWQLSQRVSTDDVILVRLTPDGSSARSQSWTYSVSGSDADERPIALTARGSRLFLAIPDHDAVDVFVLDSTKL